MESKSYDERRDKLEAYPTVPVPLRYVASLESTQADTGSFVVAASTRYVLPHSIRCATAWAFRQSSAALKACACVMAFSLPFRQSRINSPKNGKPIFPFSA